MPTYPILKSIKSLDKKNISRPTDPIFSKHEIRNNVFIFLGLMAFVWYPRDLFNAKLQTHLTDTAVIYFFFKQLQICISIYFVLI